MRVLRLILPIAFVLTCVSPAFADATLFIGNTTTPSGRQAKGFAIGAGALIIAAEFEYSTTTEKVEDGAPSLKTVMGNILFQTPLALAGVQPYFTTGAGGYRQELATVSETNFGTNIGGGAKISLIGPLRVRLDYRVFKLHSSPFPDDVVHRFYIGANLKF
jgi:opacity protein-like surface antigen